MINKKRYVEILSQVLSENYKEIKRKGTGSKERQQYIDGYLTAARALDVFAHNELKEIIDQVHFAAFGQTIEEREQTELNRSSLGHKPLDIPTYIREGISLDER